MDILLALNDSIYESEDENSTLINEVMRIFDRNIVMTVGAHQATPDYITTIIKHQNDYFTSLDYKHLPDLPPPHTPLDLVNGTTKTLRTIILNITNLMPTPNQYNVFTQVDSGMTIKSGNQETVYHRKV